MQITPEAYIKRDEYRFSSSSRIGGGGGRREFDSEWRGRGRGGGRGGVSRLGCGRQRAARVAEWEEEEVSGGGGEPCARSGALVARLLLVG